MKNRFKLLINVFIIIIIYILLSSLILIYQNKKYEKNYNESIGMIVRYVKEKYPSINQNDIISILNNKQEADYSIFSQYGSDVSNDDIIAENQITFRKTFILNIVLIATRYCKKFSIAMIVSYLLFISFAIISEIMIGSIVNNIINIDGIYNSFSIFNMVILDGNIYGIIIYSIILLTLSTYIVFKLYKNKDKVLIEYE